MLIHKHAKEITNLTATLCEGKNTMTALLLMALSINGGLYVGTIAYSTFSAPEEEK